MAAIRGGLRAMRWSTRLAGAYALWTAGAVTAWWLVGDAWWNQVVNLTTFWWSVPAIPLVVLATATRRWPAAVLLLVPAGVLVWSYGAPLLPEGSTPAEGDLRVATYNVWFRGPGSQDIVDLVRAERPDVLLLQEVRAPLADDLRRDLDDELPHAWFGSPDWVGGVGVLSRYPIVAVRDVPVPDGVPRPSAVVTVEVPTADGVQPVQVVPLHLVAACPVCRPFAAGQRAEVASRAAEIAAVLDALDPRLPAIVGGDLNGDRRADAYRSLAATGFRDPHGETGSGLGFTYPADHGRPASITGPLPVPPAHIPFVDFPVIRLDHVLVRGLVPVRASVGPARASDHLPVVVDLGLGELAPDRVVTE